MSAEQNAQTARTVYEAWNDRDFDRGLAKASEDVTAMVMSANLELRGREGYRRFMQGWATAFPDAQVEITRIVADENSAVVEFVGRGTHDGPLKTPNGEIPPTGKPIHIPFCDVLEFQDGEIIRIRNYFDTGMMLKQMGL